MKPFTTRRRREGFTLVEMLVVVLIIAVLIGLTVKILGGAGRQAAKAHTVAKIERVKNAVEEFYSEYGQYPPVPVYAGIQPVAYEYPWIEGNFGQASPYFDGIQGTGAEWGSGPMFTFGLMGFLTARHNDLVNVVYSNYPGVFRNENQWGQHNSQRASDPQRDLDAMTRWLPFLEGPPDSILHYDWAAHTVGGVPYTNWYTTVEDGWFRDLRYESKPPYQTYKLWSLGPNANDPSDDIYGHTGH
jgi:prepilin-type N-terminal cleavage/methylation domain-containing protein